MWKRQDRLLFSALLGAISLPIQPLLVGTTTSQEAWTTLANTYGKPSRGHIKQIKDQLKNYVKGSKTISEYMQFIKNRADELALLGKPVDEEDLIDKILDGLGEEYKGIVDAVNARETPISFNEIHEKLINKEASFQQSQAPPPSFPATANPVNHRRNQSWRPSHPTTDFHSQGQQFNAPRNVRPPTRPYLGYCQGCGVQGHTVKRCSLFRLVTAQSSSAPSAPRSQASRPTSPWQPRAHFASVENTETPK